MRAKLSIVLDDEECKKIQFLGPGDFLYKGVHFTDGEMVEVSPFDYVYYGDATSEKPGKKPLLKTTTERVQKLTRFLNKNYKDIQTFFDVGSMAGDYRTEIYNEDKLRVLYAPGYEYIEIYGTTRDEHKFLEAYGYNSKC